MRLLVFLCRMVNGIADSQQKGRVAVSVNSLAEAAGLSRLLVDIRHEATHNELPSLATLQLAAKQALDWLVAQYWYVSLHYARRLLYPPPLGPHTYTLDLLVPEKPAQKW